ncbi:MAG: hypothetical protein IPK00_18160 [Deltaproteobacteria bacterium]|nr:hypothetical protein [Deltaproteobacteria bacterium]
MLDRAPARRARTLRRRLPATLSLLSATVLLSLGAIPFATPSSAVTIAVRFTGPGTAWNDPANWTPALAAAPANDAGADLRFDVSIAAPECPPGGVVLGAETGSISIDRLVLAPACRLAVETGGELRILREALLGGDLAVEGGQVAVLGRRVLSADDRGIGPIALTASAGGVLDLRHVDRFAAPSIELTGHDAAILLGPIGRSTRIAIDLDESPGGAGATLALGDFMQFLGESRLSAPTADVHLRAGWLIHDQDDPADFDLSNATVTTEGWVVLEAAGRDVGADCALLEDTNFGIGRLRVGAATVSSEVRVGDRGDNGRRAGPGGPGEAIYLLGSGSGAPCEPSGGDGLVIEPGSRIIVEPQSAGSRIYAYQASTDSLVRLNDLVTLEGPVCVAAFGGAVCRRYEIFEDFTDSDLVPQWDNCSTRVNGPNQNSSQLDADQDGYGDACDTDYDQSGSTTAADFGALLGTFGRIGDRTDHTGEGLVRVDDFAVFLSGFSRSPGTPGPSWLSCANPTIRVDAGDPPCPAGWGNFGFEPPPDP